MAPRRNTQSAQQVHGAEDQSRDGAEGKTREGEAVAVGPHVVKQRKNQRPRPRTGNAGREVSMSDDNLNLFSAGQGFPNLVLNKRSDLLRAFPLRFGTTI